MIHPDIKKFWAKSGTVEESDQTCWLKIEEDQNICIAIKVSTLKRLTKDPNHLDQISNLSDDCWVYPFNKRLNSEVNMLRFIKLKAFL